ncbi:hypothetical protein FJU30_09940 [Affinibrenneria salicis]|uniref:Uncharacterized protein n=1 Tax=Affinibrenneria salicis TaxID=2590031 RepID=A0A5J5G227_9GAMM|nr:hypothetical protein [Affinibrenneria salicis]KAA9000542.1 hypothetical protein FJU30_09940 [Affinibrenneria salicis]
MPLSCTPDELECGQLTSFRLYFRHKTTSVISDMAGSSVTVLWCLFGVFILTFFLMLPFFIHETNQSLKFQKKLSSFGFERESGGNNVMAAFELNVPGIWQVVIPPQVLAILPDLKKYSPWLATRQNNNRIEYLTKVHIYEDRGEDDYDTLIHQVIWVLHAPNAADIYQKLQSIPPVSGEIRTLFKDNIIINFDLDDDNQIFDFIIRLQRIIPVMTKVAGSVGYAHLFRPLLSLNPAGAPPVTLAPAPDGFVTRITYSCRLNGINERHPVAQRRPVVDWSNSFPTNLTFAYRATKRRQAPRP